ncbi:MAG: putative toxin-antitoxin system toxin component, PIN family [Deltaproteobacteria bacterium]|nr:putative toxin-antitoxin system toxin component, PIN family [Deltaproteobacteria bacterium]
MKVAFDTDVIVAALRSRTGAANALLRALRAGEIRAIASVPMLLEYEAVLMRPAQRHAIGFTTQDVDSFLDGLTALLEPVTPHFLWRPTLRDPDDEMVLDAAVNGGVDAIITFNVKDFLPGAARFNLDILTPAEAIRRLYDKDQ